MKVIIFGASGGTGKLTVGKAIQAGHQVTAFVRSREKLESLTEAGPGQVNGLQIVEGNALEAAAVKNAIAGQDAVIVALGAPGRNKSGIRTKGTELIIQAMESQGVRRLICLSTLGIADTKHLPPWIFRNVIVPLFIKEAFADHEQQEQKVRKSNLDWTLVRPPNLTDKPGTGSYTFGFPEAWDDLVDKISREDVAAALVQQLGQPKWLQQAPAVYYPAS